MLNPWTTGDTNPPGAVRTSPGTSAAGTWQELQQS